MWRSIAISAVSTAWYADKKNKKRRRIRYAPFSMWGALAYPAISRQHRRGASRSARFGSIRNRRARYRFAAIDRDGAEATKAQIRADKSMFEAMKDAERFALAEEILRDEDRVLASTRF